MFAGRILSLARFTGRKISRNCCYKQTMTLDNSVDCVSDSEVNGFKQESPEKFLALEEITEKTKNLITGPSNSNSSDFNDEFISPEEAFKRLQKCRMEDPDRISKREEYVTWDECFMGFALMAAKRSKDPNTQVGAVLVNNKNIICGVGYNGFPINCSDDDFPWGKQKNSLLNKNSYVLHAEQNAILNCMLKSEIEGARIYTTLFPCFKCTQFLIQSGIKEIIYQNYKVDNEESIAGKAMIYKAGIKTRLFKSEKKSITLYF